MINIEETQFSYSISDNILKVYSGLDLIEVKYEVADDEVQQLAQEIIEKYNAHC